MTNMSEPNSNSTMQDSSTSTVTGDQPRRFLSDNLLGLQTPAATATGVQEEIVPMITPVQQQPPVQNPAAVPVTDTNQGLSQTQPGLVGQGNQIPPAPSQDPATVAAPAAPPPAPAAPVDDLSFSFELPSSLEAAAPVAAAAAAPATAPSTEGVVQPVALTESELRNVVNLPDDAPDWQKESFNRLAQDTEIPEQDKQLIAKLNPSNWDRARNWQKGNQIIHEIRQGNADTALDRLEKQSATGVEKLILAGINQRVSSPDKLVAFAEQYKDTYRNLMVGLVKSSPETVKTLLESEGYTVAKGEAVPVGDDFLDKLATTDPDNFTLIQGTPVEDALKQLLQTNKALAQNQKTPDSAMPVEGGTDQSDPVVVEKQTSLMTVVSSWEQDYVKALESSGLKPPTPAEMQANPAAALLRNVAYQAAVGGLGQEFPNWRDHLLGSWGSTRSDFQEIENHTMDLIEERRGKEALSRAREAAPIINEFAQLRAKTPAIQSLLSLARRLEAGTTSTAAPPTTTTLPQVPATALPGGMQPASQQQQQTTQGQQNGRGSFVADKFLHLPTDQS